MGEVLGSEGLKIQVIRSGRRKRAKIVVVPEGVVVFLPLRVGEEVAYELVERFRAWVERKRAFLVEAAEISKTLPLASRSRKELKELASRIAAEAAGKIPGARLCSVTIRKMRSRWGSCSSRGTITINEFARFLPDHLISLIVYHEVCHTVSRRHDRRFGECLQSHFPNREELEKELLAYEVKLGLTEAGIKRVLHS